MKQCITALLLVCLLTPARAQEKTSEMDRIELCKQNYALLFGGEALTGKGTDPEFMDILQKFIFGEVFAVGDLDHKTRELITCTTLAVLQTLPQLKAHANAALNVGVTPIELREAIYQTAPFIGFPRALNAIGVINEVFQSRGVSLPLEPQGVTTEETRHEVGHSIQYPIYGDAMRKNLAELPAGMGEDAARFLTEYGFGDIYSRSGLDLKTRELLVYCTLTTLGADGPLVSHTRGNIKVGNSVETLTAAVIQCLPYIGYPLALKAFNVIKTVMKE